MGGVPVGLDRAAVSSWCNKKADAYGDLSPKSLSHWKSARRTALPYSYSSSAAAPLPSAKLNHFFRITPPSLTTEAADTADAHLAVVAVAAITHTPAALYQTGHRC